MPNSDKAVAIVVALLVISLLAAFLVPVAIGAITDPSSSTYTQAIDETVTLAEPDLNATVTDVNSGVNATYTISTNDSTVTGETVAVGSNSTVTVDGNDVTIAPTEVTSTNATTDYDYPKTYNWGGGASALWDVLPVLIVLGIFLFMVQVAVKQS